MSRPLRVACVITRLEGGAGMLALRGAKVLDPDSFRVTVVTGSGGRLIDEASDAGIEVVVEPSLRAPLDPVADITALCRLGALLRQRRFDVVHTHTSKAGAAGRLAAHRAGARRIVHTYHGFGFHDFQSAARRRAYLAVERRLGRVTDVALCVGTAVAVEAVQRRLISPERVRTIGVTVDGLPAPSGNGFPLPARQLAARARARAQLRLPPEATVVGAVGRLTYQKAPEDFLAALRTLGRPGVVGVWVGAGDLAGRVARRAAAQPHAPVVLAGERRNVPELLPAFDVFTLPSRYEGLPTAVVEAMVSGVPVVATAVNAVGDVVVPGETGLLVPPARPDLLAGALRYVLDSPSDAARMAEAAHARLGPRYGADALRDALTAAYTAP